MLESCLLLRLYEPRFSSRVGRKGQSHPRRAQVSSDLVLKPERFPTYSHVVEKSHAADQADKAGPKFYRNIENSKVQHEGNGVADKRGDKNKLPVCVNYAEPRYRQINLGFDGPNYHRPLDSGRWIRCMEMSTLTIVRLRSPPESSRRNPQPQPELAWVSRCGVRLLR